MQLKTQEWQQGQTVPGEALLFSLKEQETEVLMLRDSMEIPFPLFSFSSYSLAL